MRLIQAVYPAIQCRGDVWPELPQRAASGSVVLPYLGSVVMSVAALSLKDLWVPGIWATTQGHIGVRGPCCRWDHTDLSGHRCYLGPCCWAWITAEDHVWLCGPIKVRV